jgi:hypothetical protein
VCLSPVVVERWDASGTERESPFEGSAVFINAARSTVEFASEAIGVQFGMSVRTSGRDKAVWGSIVR